MAMSRTTLYLEPPHLLAAFYLDRRTPAAAFGLVCERVERAGAIPSGALSIVRGAGLPPFGMISDLAPHLESQTLDMRGRQRQEWERLVRGTSSAAQVLRAGFSAPKVGGVVVEFQPIPDDAVGRTLHPVAVVVSGALLSVLGIRSLPKKERRQAEETVRFTTTVFRSICEGLDPLYAGILVEASLPAPPALIAGSARMGTELFVSSRLEAVIPGVKQELAALFANGFHESWATGLFLSGWDALNPGGLGIEAPVAVGAQAARILGRALSMAPLSPPAAPDA